MMYFQVVLSIDPKMFEDFFEMLLRNGVSDMVHFLIEKGYNVQKVKDVETEELTSFIVFATR